MSEFSKTIEPIPAPGDMFVQMNASHRTGFNSLSIPPRKETPLDTLSHNQSGAVLGVEHCLVRANQEAAVRSNAPLAGSDKPSTAMTIQGHQPKAENLDPASSKMLTSDLAISLAHTLANLS
jgi:hypothetical protein